MVLDSLNEDDSTYNGMYLLDFSKSNLLKIGRNNTNDIVIKDISVSREHAEIKLIDN